MLKKYKVNQENRKASLEAQERNREILNDKGAQNKNMEQTKTLPRKEQNITGKNISKIPVLETYMFKSPNRKETRIGDNAKWNKLVKLANKDGNKNNCDLNSPMSRLEENMLMEAHYYCGQSSSASSSRVIESNTSTPLLNNNPEQGEAVAEAPNIINNNVAIEQQRAPNFVLNNLRIIGFCIGFATALTTFYLAYNCYIDPVPEKVEVPRTLVQKYFYDYVNNMFK